LAIDLQSGMLISVPIPADAAANGEFVEKAIQQALDEAHAQKIIGMFFNSSPSSACARGNTVRTFQVAM